MSNAGEITTEIENKIANDYQMRNSIRKGIDRCVPDVFSQWYHRRPPPPPRLSLQHPGHSAPMMSCAVIAFFSLFFHFITVKQIYKKINSAAKTRQSIWENVLTFYHRLFKTLSGLIMSSNPTWTRFIVNLKHIFLSPMCE